MFNLQSDLLTPHKHVIAVTHAATSQTGVFVLLDVGIDTHCACSISQPVPHSLRLHYTAKTLRSAIVLVNDCVPPFQRLKQSRGSIAGSAHDGHPTREYASTEGKGEDP